MSETQRRSQAVGEPLSSSQGAAHGVTFHRVVARATTRRQTAARRGEAGDVDGAKAAGVLVGSNAGGAAKRAVPAAVMVAGMSSFAGAAAAGAAAVQAFRGSVAEPLAALLVIAACTSCTTAVVWLGVAITDHRTAPPTRMTARGPSSDGLAVVEEELRRSRRYERTLAVVRLAPTPMGRRDARWRDGVSLSSGYASQLGNLLRSTDHWWQEGSSLFFLLPETDREHAEDWVRRLCDGLPGLPSEVAVAVFPSDGVTAAALRARLNQPRQAVGVES